MALVRGLSVSSCGDKVWAGHIIKKVNKKYISRLMMYDFKKKSHFLYDHEHTNLIVSVVISEEFKSAMSGGWDKTLVLHGLETGKTIKRFVMKYGYIQCLFDLGTAVAVGDKHTVRFLELETRKMSQFKVKINEKSILCMNLSIGERDHNNNVDLLIGRQNSNKMEKICISKAIARNARDILEMQNETKNFENFKGNFFFLEKENKKLREENQKLKQKFKQIKKEKTDAITKYVKKINILSNQVKNQNAINTRLQEDINLFKNQLTTLKSKIIQGNPAKRNLLIYQALKKYRKIKTKNDYSSTNSDDSSIEDNPHLPTKVEELKEKVRNQLDQIHALRLETNRLENKEQDHQTLREEFDNFVQYYKQMTKKNSKLKEVW